MEGDKRAHTIRDAFICWRVRTCAVIVKCVMCRDEKYMFFALKKNWRPSAAIISEAQTGKVNIYGGWLPLPEQKDCYINLSRVELTTNQKEV